MKVRVMSHGYNVRGGSLQIELTGLTDEAKNKLLATLLGQNYVTIKKREELHFVTAKKDIPLETDKEMAPFWRKHKRSKVPTQMELWPGSGVKEFSVTGASFIIQHLCGYNYTDEKYKEEAEKLHSFGFECLRSKRDEDATFLEVWFLPGYWSTKGKLSRYIEGYKSSEKKDEAIINFLRSNCSFGTLDAMVQRLAMCIPD